MNLVGMNNTVPFASEPCVIVEMNTVVCHIAQSTVNGSWMLGGHRKKAGDGN